MKVSAVVSASLLLFGTGADARSLLRFARGLGSSGDSSDSSSPSSDFGGIDHNSTRKLRFARGLGSSSDSSDSSSPSSDFGGIDHNSTNRKLAPNSRQNCKDKCDELCEQDCGPDGYFRNIGNCMSACTKCIDPDSPFENTGLCSETFRFFNSTRKLADYGIEAESSRDDIALDEECNLANGKEELWPLPKHFSKGDQTRVLSHELILDVDKPNPTLSKAFDRYKQIMFPSPNPSSPKENSEDSLSTNMLRKVRVSVEDWSEEHPQLETKEDYTLDIPFSSVHASSDTIHISASTIYGALHALETLSQLIKYDHEKETHIIESAPWSIQDKPRFRHRGLMIDTARHFLAPVYIKAVLDSMSYAKLNVLHWHMTDNESFPLKIKSHPSLSDGAFSKEERYTQTEVADIVEHARLRGIRVVVEMDMPGHAASWCEGMPEICPSAQCKSPLDASNEITFEVIDAILEELTSSNLFPDDMFHLGGDEVDPICWLSEDRIASWLFDNQMLPEDAYKYFVKRVADIARSKTKRPVQWVEVFENFGQELHEDTIVHVWKDKSILKDVVAAGYDAVLSDEKNLYLNHLDTYWFHVYLDEPFEDIASPKLQRKVLGGQVHLWGEQIDGSNLLNTIWPRAAAFAERMWSPREIDSPSCALPRIQKFRKLLLTRGIPSAPVTNTIMGSVPMGPSSSIQ